MKSAWLEIKDGETEASINLFLQKMLEDKLVDAVLVPAELPSKGDVAPTLITEPGILAQARPLAPVMPVSQKPRDGLSPERTAPASAVASGSVPSITAP